jgi:hypothetical protein
MVLAAIPKDLAPSCLLANLDAWAADLVTGSGLVRSSIHAAPAAEGGAFLTFAERGDSENMVFETTVTTEAMGLIAAAHVQTSLRARAWSPQVDRVFV